MTTDNKIKIKLWHCHNARSLRPLWALEEMGFDYELIELPFPPRVFKKDFLSINSLGTIPYFVDNQTHMTESSAIGLYLVERYQRYDFGLEASHPEYGDYLNWQFHSDATLTFPQTIALRYGVFEKPERRSKQIADDYRKWFIARLNRLSNHLIDREFLCANKFTVADIAVAYALYLGELLGFDNEYKPQVIAYLQRMKARPLFQKVVVIGEENSNFKGFKRSEP
ncbi:MAG: glutathione S-transferase [Alteromonas sp.]|jgi:glutathione S-transferase|uniref:Glutathione S-transferase n=1 Tax=Paraglaciecola chathamensis TaxID=368405 RepID=A0A8H9IHJ9_9ALTE|nr:glutathione S-transferase family protein [Paraglaciecola oceanifecundans]MAI64990.1 glutathione S-transferase [Alteromonas sp.]GGZ83714.1 glutathione S-transferase [Paraglaciecola oceanifecundans]|tara:strand:+ start:2635 stop:3309 length:675 start_codon:yes stop_codon:yes gene_type:complete